MIIDIDHDPENKEELIVRLFKKEEGEVKIERVPYRPYIKVIGEREPPKLEGVVSVERAVFREGFREVKGWLVRFRHSRFIQRVKKEYESLGFECREYDLGPEFQFLLENPRDMSVNLNELVRAAIDIEVIVGARSPDPSRDPIAVVSYVDSEGYEEVLHTKEKNEQQLLSEITRVVRDRDPDVLYTYNGDRFDFPYMKERAKLLGVKLRWGRDGSELMVRRTAVGGTGDIRGRAHVDVYRIAEFFESIGVINVPKLELESVYEAVMGKQKPDMDGKTMKELWERGEIEPILEYNLSDSRSTLELGDELVGVYTQLSGLLRTTLYSATRMSASQMVEDALSIKAYERNILIPRRPKEAVVRERMRRTYPGGYVMDPVPGVYTNIAVLDFRSLYPSIMISHNVDPYTLNGECEDRHVAPTGAYFCKQPEGLIPSMLREFLTLRSELKRRLKTLEKGTHEYVVLDSKQRALKIVANATYGYLGYARARWYCYECASAITAWARTYIMRVIELARSEGFRVIYGDTDSLFIVYSDKERVLSFVEKVNRELPDPMELEIEAFYRRGIFLPSRKGDKAAKKRYVLLDEKGNLKIVGLEYVRRDWSGIARKVQREVIERILVRNDVEGAVNYVREIIEKLRKGEVKKEDLVIYTEVQKRPEEYKQRGPHVYAMIKARRRGLRVEPGTIIGYIITRGGGNVSERAEPEEFVEEGDYDPDYYIERQVLPVVLPIFEVVGVSRSKLLGASSLFDFA